MGTYSTTILADTPSLYWRLGETSGTNANDETANNRDGTYAAGITLDQSPLIGDTDRAITCSGGSTGKVTSGYNPFTSASTRTYEGWARRTASSTQDTLFGSDTGSANNNVVLRMEAGAPATVKFFPRAVNSCSWTTVWPGNNRDVYWVLVFNDSTKIAELYLNGISQGALGTTDAYNVTPGNLVLAAWLTTNQPWHGKMDEFAVYESGLTADQIMTHYRAGTRSPPFQPRTARNMLVRR